MEPLLPDAPTVRCTLHLDIALQVRGLMALAELKNYDERELGRQIRQARDASLFERLQQIIPIEELALAIEDDRLSLDVLCERLPFVHVMWVVATAREMARASEAIAATHSRTPPDAADSSS